MSLEAIKQITNAEQKSDSIISEANLQAKQMILRAQASSAAHCDKMNKEATEKASLIIKASGDEAAVLMQTQREIIAKECVELKQNAKSNIDKAVALVMEKVVSE